MSFMTLPAEIRGLVYHAFLTNNASCQHVIPVPRGLNGYDRFPCQAIPDHAFLRNLSKRCGRSGWGDYLETMRFSEWRGGHLACEPGTLFHRSERLPSALPLFLTCRQVYHEAAAYLHGAPLVICTEGAFEAFVGRTVTRTPRRVEAAQLGVEVQLVVDPIRRRDGGFGIDREFVRRLARLDLSSVRLTILGPVDADRARWLLQTLSRGEWSEGKGSIELVSPTATRVAAVRLGNGCQATVRPDVTWARVVHMLEERGDGEFRGSLTSYDMLVRVAGDLGLDIQSDSSRKSASRSIC